jgi:hypothetical protein
MTELAKIKTIKDDGEVEVIHLNKLLLDPL